MNAIFFRFVTCNHTGREANNCPGEIIPLWFYAVKLLRECDDLTEIHLCINELYPRWTSRAETVENVGNDVGGVAAHCEVNTEDEEQLNWK